VAVSWSKPQGLDKAKQVADQARIFACSSALVFGADVFDSFLREFASETWLGFQTAAQEIATKAKTRPQDHGGAYSMAERAAALCVDLCLDDDVKIAALDLLSKWRNVVVHNSEGHSRLSADRRNTLIAAASEFHKKYSHLDIELALRNFESGKMPVPKEATSLIAVAVNFSRWLDEAAIRRAALSSGQMVISAEQMLRDYFRSPAGRTISPWTEISDAWQGGATRRMNMLKKFLQNAGITENKNPISATLPETFLEDIVALTREDFALRFEIARPR
jgi:hypothetical protein